MMIRVSFTPQTLFAFFARCMGPMKLSEQKLNMRIADIINQRKPGGPVMHAYPSPHPRALATATTRKESSLHPQINTTVASIAVSFMLGGLVCGPVIPSSLADDKFDFPNQLSSEKEAPQTSLRGLISGANGKEVEKCTRKCLPACIRGGEGAPGLGPLSLRKELVKFKDGFRSRSYCLRDCTEVCSLSINGPNSPPPPP